MNYLPVVQSGIKDSILRSYQDTPQEESYLLTWWSGFRDEQPILAKIAMEEITTFKSAKEAAAFSHGIWLVYESLRSQHEATEMNRAWGTNKKK